MADEQLNDSNEIAFPGWVKVVDFTGLSLSDHFFETMPRGVDRIYAPGNELTGLDVIRDNCNATELDFSGNQITNISRTDFICKEKLISISLSDNLIQTLDRGKGLQDDSKMFFKSHK